MKKILFLLVIPFLSFGQFENPIINCPDKTCIETYAVRSHPEFSQKTGELIISYVTSYTGDYKHANINSYRPRFIKVQLEKVN